MIYFGVILVDCKSCALDLLLTCNIGLVEMNCNGLLFRIAEIDCLGCIINYEVSIFLCIVKCICCSAVSISFGIKNSCRNNTAV